MQNNSLKVQENSILPGNKGHYLVEKFLGEGTFGKVVKCRDLLTDKHVAIKIMKRNDEGEEEIKALTELSKINADAYNLVNFVEWFRYKSDICIVFEMLDKNFNDLMKDRQSSPLDLKEVRAIAWQLIVALKGLKKLNLVHCDIKPDNIMLVDHILKPFRLKLIDFGLAEKTKNLKKGTPMQNRMFRAPEVILGLPLDESLDMWTVGYILAFLYSGYYIHPWDCEYNTIRIVWKLDTEQFVDLLKQMLEMDPKKRISPDGALQHPFFNLKKMNPKTTKPQEPAAAEAHQEPEAKEVKSVSQGPAANPQKRSSDTSKKSSVQQQKTEERKAPSVSRKRKRSDQESQETPSQGPAANPQKRSSNTSKKSSVQQQKSQERKAPSVSRKRKRSDQESQEPPESSESDSPVPKRRRSWKYRLGFDSLRCSATCFAFLHEEISLATIKLDQCLCPN
uniref:Protein kinase domain-containing protein n=1 Tax=Oryzias melastigma TaxID=30732 RepID=A0A3B3DP84_ORYME